MELTLLEEDQRRFFDENGYFVVPNALTPREVAQLTAVSDRMTEETEQEEYQGYNQYTRSDGE